VESFGGRLESDLLSFLHFRSRLLIQIVKAMSESRSVGSSRAASSSLTSFENLCRYVSNSDSGFQALSSANVRNPPYRLNYTADCCSHTALAQARALPDISVMR
jgi:hypothetical protein